MDTVVFQSTTPSTPPDATIIATDDAGAAGQVQIMKLAVSANGDATPTPATATDGLLVNLGANNDVTIAALPLPSGAATAANQATEITALATLVTQTDGVEASLASLDAKTTAVNTGAVVVASSALPSGASTEATLATRALESGGNLAAAAASLAVLDNIVAGNEAQVDIVTSALPTGASTLAEQQTQTTALQLIDDAVITDDVTTFTAGTNKGLAIAGAVDDDSTDAADEGDMAIVRVTKERKLRTVAALDSAFMQSGNDQVTPKFAAIAASSSGDNTLVTGVSNKKLRVLNYVLMSNGTVNAKFQSATGGDITGLLYLVANTGASSGYSPTGHFETAAGEDLQLNLSGAIAVGGHLSYIEVD